MNGILIAGFGAIGKTTVAKKYKNLLDLESSNFKYIILKLYFFSNPIF